MKELNDSNLELNLEFEFFFALLLGFEYEIERIYDYGGMNERKIKLQLFCYYVREGELI